MGNTFFLLVFAPCAVVASERELDLTASWITDSDLAHVGRMQSLERLDLAHTKITDVGLQHLKGLSRLKELSLYYAEYITDDGLAVLKYLPALEKLNLRGTRVTSKVFEHVSHLKNLRELDLAFTEITDEGFEHLIELEKLEKLAIGGNRLSGECLQMLLQVPSLQELDVGGTQRVDSGLWGLALTTQNLERLGRLTQLRRLSLAGATLADRGVDRPGHPEAERLSLDDLSPLRGLVNLEFLDLSRQPLSPAALESLQGMPKLREIRRAGIQRLGSARPTSGRN